MDTVAATETSSREARRRRILERGSDRFALITGRIQSLPPDPEQSRPQASLTGQPPADPPRCEANTVSNSLLAEHGADKEPSQCHILDKTEEPSPPNHEKVNNTSSREAGELSMFNSEQGKNTSSRKEPLTLDGNKGKGITSRAAALLGIEEEMFQVSSSTRTPTLGHQPAKTLRSSHTAGQLRSAIAATENIRICSSAAAAILVLLSITGFPIPGGLRIKHFKLLRPLYLLFLTNISVVLACFITQGPDSWTRQTSRASAAGVGKAIEAGLLLQNILTALFMDLIYAILLICGLSIIQRVGW